MKNHRFDDLREGQEAFFDVLVQDEDIERFAEVSGDHSAIHMSAEVARAKGFPGRVGHGALAGAYVSRLVGMELPGENALIQTMNLRFHRPFHPGDVLHVHGRVREKHASVRAVLLEVTLARGEEKVATATILCGLTA